MLKEIRLNYWDQKNSIQAKLFFEKNSANLKFIKDVYQAEITGNANCRDCRFPGSNIDKMQNAALSYQLDYINDRLDIKSLKLLSEGLELNAIGNIMISGKFPANIQVEDCKINLDTVSKYIPNTLFNEYKINKVGGALSLNASINGDLLDSILPQTSVDLNLIKGEIVSQVYPVINQIDLSCKMGNGEFRNLKSTFIDCEKLSFSSNKSRGGLRFHIKDFTQPHYLFSSDLDLNLCEFKSFIPDSLIRIAEGQIQVLFTGKGNMSSWSQLQDVDYLRQNCTANIKLKNLFCEMDSSLMLESVSTQLSFKQDTIRIENLIGYFPQHHLNIRNASLFANLKGSMTDLNQFGLDVDSLQIETDSCQILVAGSLNNLLEPDYKITSQSKLNLAEIMKMIPDSLVADMKGQIEIGFDSEGHIHPDSISQQMTDLLLNKSNTNIDFNKVSVKMPDPMMNINNFSGQLALERDTIRINKSRGSFSGMDFKVDSTKIINYYNTLIDNKAEQLTVMGSLHFGDIDYALVDSLMQNYEQQSDTTIQEGAGQPRNYNFQVQGRLSGNSFKYKNAKFTDIQSLLNVSDSLYIFDQFKFNAFEGKVNNAIKFRIDSDNRQSLAISNKTEQINISQLLKDFDNFKEYEQDYIVAEQISGKLTTELHGQFLILGDTLVSDSTMVKGNLKLEDGGLFNYQPAQELSKYTNIEELDNLQFKTIESQVFVFKNAVFVPQTEIKSNAMDISAYGMQTFGDDFEYHLRIYLGEILYGKTKRIRERQEKMKNKPDGGTSGLKSLFVVSKSIDGKLKNGLDSKKDRMRMKTKIKLQNVVLDIIFHPKLENFKTGVSQFSKTQN